MILPLNLTFTIFSLYVYKYLQAYCCGFDLIFDCDYALFALMCSISLSRTRQLAHTPHIIC